MSTITTVSNECAISSGSIGSGRSNVRDNRHMRTITHISNRRDNRQIPTGSPITALYQ